MAVTTLTFFRFRGPWARLWALMGMQLSKGPLRRLPGIGFHKLLGSGKGRGFDLAPNFGVYAILATWPSLEAARDQIEHSRLFGRYRRRAEENWTIYLETSRTKGSWDAGEPFAPAVEAPETGAESSNWVGVLTRATVRPGGLLPFWRTVPPVSELTAGYPGLHFQLGMGELPVIQLMTFSVWNEAEPIDTFAYKPGPHRDAMKLARRHKWFKEELFARFRVLQSSGTWGGTDPIRADTA